MLLRYLATSRMFTRVLSECWRPLHLVFGGYYFFIASKIGADRRVMGIALAIEPLQGWSGFLSAPNDLYPWCPVDQVRCGWIRSAVHLHLYVLRCFTARIVFYRLAPLFRAESLIKKVSPSQPIWLAESIQNRYPSLWLERGIRPKRQR